MPAPHPAPTLAWRVVLVLNLLDLTSAIIPSPIDAVRPLAPRSTVEWAVQGALLVPLLVWWARRLPAWTRWLAALPLPPRFRWLLLAVFSLEIGHIALRREQYPFTPVAMFSSLLPPLESDIFVDQTFVVLGPEGPEPMSAFREGSALFARHLEGLDYKAGWVLRQYGPTHSTAVGELTRLLEAQGLPPPALIQAAYRVEDGRYLTREGPPR